MRAQIAEDEGEGTALGKLRHTVAEHISDAEEREWIKPRHQPLLGLTARINSGSW